MAGVAIVLIALLFLVYNFDFGGREHPKQIELAASISKELPDGTSKANVQSFLKKHGIEATYTEDKQEVTTDVIINSMVEGASVKDLKAVFAGSVEVPSRRLGFESTAYITVYFFIDNRDKLIKSQVLTHYGGF